MYGESVGKEITSYYSLHFYATHCVYYGSATLVHDQENKNTAYRLLEVFTFQSELKEWPFLLFSIQIFQIYNSQKQRQRKLTGFIFYRIQILISKVNHGTPCPGEHLPQLLQVVPEK